MSESKIPSSFPGMIPLRSLLKTGTDDSLDLATLSRYLEERFHYPPLTFLRKTHEGLLGSWNGSPVRIAPSTSRYRQMASSLKTSRGVRSNTKPWALLFPVFVGQEWVGCLAVGQDAGGKELSRHFLESWIPLLVWTLGMVLENRQLGKMLERADRQSSLGFLSAGVFHEIRNPLTALSTLIQLLPLKKNDPAFMDSFQALMLKELERLEVLTDQSLKFARTGGKTVEDVDLQETLERIHQLIRPSLGRKKIRFLFRVEQGLSLKVEQAQFESLAVNLLKNAINAVGGKGLVQVSAKRLRPGKGIVKSWVCLSVKDDGKGIPSGEIERIFDPYFTTRNGGTGLGLAICQRIMENHGGHLKVKSKRRQGTVFTAYFPSHYRVKNKGFSDFQP